ncbi:MAG: 3-keto-5-aminohexanoate cleavage protein [Candidatus Lokiarchaeota archaeon]|nr:3-keto-5-aminohexanoate cleavage protein [Candidatus Lokiarchaeota archaeon]
MVHRTDNLVISAALAGAVTRKDQNEAVPYTPEEFGDEAKRCYDAGAAIVHIHARDEQGLPTPDLDIIQETLENIKKKAPDIIINLSTAISINATDRERIKPVRTFKPPLASLNTNSMNFSVANWKTGEVVMAADNVFTNTFKTIQRFASYMQKAGTKPEMEIYDMGGLYNMLLLDKQEGMFDHPLHFQCVFGVCGGIPFTPMNFAHFLNVMPEDATWSVCGVANQQFQAALSAIGWGGHVRVGLEDNIRMPNGDLAKGSWEQVAWAKEMAEKAGRNVVQGEEARKEFNIKNKEVSL